MNLFGETALIILSIIAISFTFSVAYFTFKGNKVGNNYTFPTTNVDNPTIVKVRGNLNLMLNNTISDKTTEEKRKKFFEDKKK